MGNGSMYTQLYVSELDRHLHAYLVSMATVLGGQDKSRQVARQLQPFKVPHEVPEDDGVLVDNARGGDCLVALIYQHALQLLPQNQRAQVGHRHWSGASSPAALLLLRGCCR